MHLSALGNSIYINPWVKMILEMKSASHSKGNIWVARTELGGTVDTDAWVSHDILHRPYSWPAHILWSRQLLEALLGVQALWPHFLFCLAGNSHMDFNGKKLSTVHKRIKHLKMLYTCSSDVFKYASLPSSPQITFDILWSDLEGGQPVPFWRFFSPTH